MQLSYQHIYFLNFSFLIWRFFSSRLVIVMLPENTFLKYWISNLAFFESNWGENGSNGLFSTSRLVLLFRRRARYSFSIEVVNQRRSLNLFDLHILNVKHDTELSMKKLKYLISISLNIAFQNYKFVINSTILTR